MFIQNLTDSIGNTPLLRLAKLFPDSTVYAKIEGVNPGGSIKDRAAFNMITQAIMRGELTSDKTILEATSGNMGIALAWLGASRGFKVAIVMSEAMSDERKKMLKALGAELILTPAAFGTAGAIAKAQEMLAANPKKYWFANQFNNPDNAAAYENIMGKELLADLPQIDFLVGGVATAGTMVGLGKYFKKNSPATEVVGVLPPAGFKIQGIQNHNEDFAAGLLDLGVIDKEIAVTIEEAYDFARRISREEGVFVGMSSGAALAAASKLTIPAGKNVVVILPDRGEKYLSTDLYQG
ncbi:MAG: cysteine synthase family protein [Candidatus Gracilibacteria bacterium]|jgi:cysteinyl-tRNA synthetase